MLGGYSRPAHTLKTSARALYSDYHLYVMYTYYNPIFILVDGICINPCRTRATRFVFTIILLLRALVILLRA